MITSEDAINELFADHAPSKIDDSYGPVWSEIGVRAMFRDMSVQIDRLVSELAVRTSPFAALKKQHDQLRAELAEAKGRADAADSLQEALTASGWVELGLKNELAAAQQSERSSRDEADGLAADLSRAEEDLAAAQRTITQLREDAVRVNLRMDEAVWIIVEAGVYTDAHWKSRRAAFLAASGSSTGEARVKNMVCGHVGIVAGCCDQPSPLEPAAPEPAPAMQKPCPHRTTIIACPGIISGDGFCNKCGAKDFGEKPAAPASAQGTTEPLSQLDRIEVDIAALELARDENLEWREALDKRVKVLEAASYCEHGARRDTPGHGWCDRPHVPAAPPQPAPVERHAFVPGPGMYLGSCWHGVQPGGIGDACGQPRSAAVHGTGEGNG